MINKIKDIIHREKILCVHSQNYVDAARWRSVEQECEKVIDNSQNLTDFINYVKREGNIEIYEVIKQLDRKEKIYKIEKLHNKI